MDNKTKAYFDEVKAKLVKAIAHLEYSYNKVLNLSLPTDLEKIDEEQLEVWESYCARFSRVVDIFLMKYLKLAVKIDDPGFSGTLRDFLNCAAKMKLINDVESWLQKREFRNITAHEYSTESFELFLKQLLKHTPELISLKSIIVK